MNCELEQLRMKWKKDIFGKKKKYLSSWNSEDIKDDNK